MRVRPWHKLPLLLILQVRLFFAHGVLNRIGKRIESLTAEKRSVITGAHFEVIGMITITWTFLEIGLDMINEVILTRAGGSHLEKSIPASLKPKLALIKLGFSKLDGLRDLEGEALEIVAQVNALKEKRNDVIHGVTHGEIEKNVRTIFRHVYSGQTLRSRTVRYSFNDLFDFNKEVGNLAKRVIALGKVIETRFPKGGDAETDERNEPLR